MKTLSLISYQRVFLLVTVLLISFLCFVCIVFFSFPVHANANPPTTWGFSVDWKGCIRPDTLLILSGHSPYEEGCGVNPPWTYILLAPIALLPPALGAAVLFSLTYFVYCIVFYLSGAKPWMLLGIIFSPLVYINAYNGNIDWIPILGFVLPPQIGLFFVLIKPQIGAGIALYWFVKAWRTGRIREILRIFTPVSMFYIISFFLYGLWPFRLTGMVNDDFNASFLPFSLVVGIPLMLLALRFRKKFFAVAATPFLSPYINIHSYAIVLFSLIPYKLGFTFIIVLSILFWLKILLSL